MSNKKNNGVETVLPAIGSGGAGTTGNNNNQDPKIAKQELKTKIASLKSELKSAEKELSKLGPKPKTATNKIVKKKGLAKNKK